MTLWAEGEPRESEWERNATREADAASFRRISKIRYDPESECEHSEDPYQVIRDGAVVAEQTFQRSPATRSYTQAQARSLYEEAGFQDVQLYSEFTFEPVRPEDRLSGVLGRKPG